MSYRVLARAWRPQQFDAVVGQDHVVETLRNAIRSNRVAHAYMFVGPRGTGKTSMARIFAKALNCRTGMTDKPCDACDSCAEIMAGNCMDVIEMDAASNTSVDYVRELRENAQYTPVRGPFKIYIIDEVHMLSSGAFNALLKTLEEPPPHVKFFFATTEPQKVPATILSRCQRFDLRRIPTPAIVGRLREIATAEELEIADDALLAIARGADGGLRDAESALDQLIAFRGKKLTEEDVLSVFGLVSRATLEQLADAVLAGDMSGLLTALAELDAHGIDLQRVVTDLIAHFRNLLVCRYTDAKAGDLDLTEAQGETVRRQAERADPGTLLNIIQSLNEAEGRLRFSLSRRTVVEAALIRCARAATAVSLDAVLEQIERLKTSTCCDEQASTPAPTVRAQAERPVEQAPVTQPAAGPAVDEVGLLSSGWRDIVDQVGRAAALAKSSLLDAKPIRTTAATVALGFDPEFAQSKDRLSALPRAMTALKRALSEALRRPVNVELTVLDARSTLPGDIKIDPEAPNDEKPAPQGRKSAREWAKDPTVQRVLEGVNGEIIDIRE